MAQGKYIVLEGGEMVGKSTQARTIAETINAEHVREPGATQVGAMLRSMLLDPNITTAPMTEVMMFAADRAQLMHEVVRPATSGGQHVVSDRSWISGAAYQSARGVDLDTILHINRLAIGEFMRPDLVVVLDADPAEVAYRRYETADYFELMGLDFHRQVRTNILALGKELGAAVINALQPQEAVTEQIMELVSNVVAEN